MVLNAVSQAAGNKELIQQVISTWDRILTLTYGVEVDKTNSVEALTEQSMLEEYEKIKNLRPEFKLEKNGKIIIKGFESFLRKT